VTVAVIDYGSGNLRSAAKACERAAADAGLDERILVTARAEEAASAERIVLPGVGAFADCMAGLAALPGMLEALEEAVRRKGRPFLGICVGMQLMAERGVEFGAHPGLGWLAGEVARIAPADSRLKVPHMGWNQLEIARPHPLFDGLGERPFVYFLHSYAFRPAEPATLAETEYGGPVCAAVGRDNLLGVQFHPEKSQDAGLRLIANFLRWRP
jgi:glutamine amidotransferase